MDASHLTFAAALLVLAIAVGRAASGPLSRAGDGMAVLFVPPDRALGWPHGVQESDEPWAWRSAAASTTIDADGTDPSADRPHGGSGSDDRSLVPRTGSLVVPVGRVAPIHVGVRPH